MHLLNLTLDERERIAYANNDTQAPLLGMLADHADQGEAISSALAYLQEARSCFPSEDCLQSVLDLLRKSKAAVARDALELLEAIADELHREADYGREQLDAAVGALS